LSAPDKRWIPEYLGQPHPLRLLPIGSSLFGARQVGGRSRHTSPDGGALLLGEIGDRPRLLALDRPAPAVRALLGLIARRAHRKLSGTMQLDDGPFAALLATTGVGPRYDGDHCGKRTRKHGLVTQENRFRLRETPHQAPADWFRTMAWPSGPQSRPWSATGPSRGRQPARALARGHGDRPVGPPAQDGAPPPPALNARRRTPREIAGASLLIPGQRPIPQHLGQPQPLRLPPIKDRPHDVGAQGR
jgi:hypothetical protein